MAWCQQAITLANADPVLCRLMARSQWVTWQRTISNHQIDLNDYGVVLMYYESCLLGYGY